VQRGVGCLSLGGQHTKAAAHIDGTCAVRLVRHLPISTLSRDRSADRDRRAPAQETDWGVQRSRATYNAAATTPCLRLPACKNSGESGHISQWVHISGGTAAGTGAWMATKTDPDDDSDTIGPHQYAD